MFHQHDNVWSMRPRPDEPPVPEAPAPNLVPKEPRVLTPGVRALIVDVVVVAHAMLLIALVFFLGMLVEDEFEVLSAVAPLALGLLP